MLGELGPLSVDPCRARMQTSLAVKSPNALISVDSVSRNQALFSPQPFDPLISQSTHMVLRADTLHPSQLPRMKRSQLLECLSLWRGLCEAASHKNSRHQNARARFLNVRQSFSDNDDLSLEK